MSGFKGLLYLPLSLGLMLGVAEAQVTTGGIRGIVQDETGAVLVGVTVEAQSPARIGSPAVEITNNMGLYRFEQFPAGTYVVTFSLQGFATIRRENVRVEVGRSTQLDMTMTLAGAEETVTVTAESPVIDTVHAQYTTNFNEELVVNVPTTRNSYYDVIKAVPGVQGSADFTYFGSNIDQNSYQIDGIEVSAPDYGRAWAWPNYDIIQEIEVLGVGASAEYAGFQGGVVNVVTKSGSNRWGGKATAFLVDDWMLANNTPEEEFPPKIDYFTDLTFELGGPIIKDKFWIVGTIQSWRRRQVPIGVELIPEVEPCHEIRTFFKANAQASDQDNLTFHFDNNNFKCASPPTRTEPLETTSTEHGTNPVISARWTRMLGADTLLELKGGGLYIRDRYDPTLENYEDSSHFDFATGLTSVNAFGAWRSIQNKTEMSGTLTHYADDFIKGSHDFKFGAQVSLATANSYQSYFNNALYYDYAGPYYIYSREPYGIAGTVNTFGGFVNDNWTVNDRVALNLGVRFDHTTGSIPEVEQLDVRLENPTGTFPGIPDVINFNNVSPRLGLSVKLDARGKTVAKAGYGRYYGKLVTNMFDTLSPGNTSVNALLYNEETGQYDIPFYTVDFNSNFDVDRSLRNQYTDQFLVGIEREVLPDFGLQAMFIYKNEDDFIRVNDVQSVFETIPFEETLEGVTQTLMVYNRVSPASESLYQVTNREDFDHSYKAVIVQGSKRWSQNWQLNASYQWQRGVGYAGARGAGRWPGDLQGAGSLNQRAFGRDPNDLINAYGRLPSDSTHIVKASGSYLAPWGINLGVRFTYEDGRPYGRVVNVRLDQGLREVFAEPSGAYKLDTLYDVGIRIDKDFRMGGEKRLRISMDIFNLLNSDAATSVVNNSSQENYGLVTRVVYPRQAMFGVRFEF